MKKALTILTALIVAIFFAYVIFAFILNSANPFDWETNQRVGMMFLSALIACGTIGYAATELMD